MLLEMKRMTKMSKTITISKELEKAIYVFCNDELSWHIRGCNISEYEDESLAEIELLRLLGYTDEASEWKKIFTRTIRKECDNDDEV